MTSESRNQPSILQHVTKFLSLPFTIVLIGFIVCNLVYFLHGFEFFPSHDTQFSYQIFYSVYNELFVNHQIPFWRPEDQFGMPSNLYLLFSIGYAQILSIMAGNALGVSNVLLMFKLSILLEQLILISGVFLLSKLIHKHKITHIFVGLIACATISWGNQIWWNFRFYSLMPIVFYFIILFWQSGKVSSLLLGCIVYLIGQWGSLPYYLPVHAFQILVLVVVLIVRTRKFPKLIWTYSSIGYGLFIILTSFVYFQFLQHSHDYMANYSPGRDPFSLHPSMYTFLTYSRGIGLPSSLELLFAVPATTDYQIYIGLIPLALFIFALWNMENIYLQIFAILTVATYLLSLSSSSFIAPIAYHFIPLMNLVRHIGFFKILAKIPMIICAGFGLEHLYDHPETKRKFIKVCAVLIFGMVCLSFIGRFENGGSIYDGESLSWKFYYLPLLLLCLFVGMLSSPPVWLRSLPMALLIFSVLDVFSYHSSLEFSLPDKMPHSGRAAEIDPYLHAEKVQQIQNAIYTHPYSYSNQRNDRIPDQLEGLLVNYYPVSSATLHQDICFWNGRIDWISQPVDQFFHARVSRFPEAKHQLLLPQNFSSDEEMLKAMGCRSPKITIHHSVRIAENFQQSEAQIASATDLGSVPSILTNFDDTKSVTATKSQNEKSEVTIEKFTANQIHFTVDMKYPGWVVYKDSYHPNWKAFVDEKQVPIAIANLAFKSVFVEKGIHQVHMEYVIDKSTKMLFASIVIFSFIMFFIQIKLIFQCYTNRNVELETKKVL